MVVSPSHHADPFVSLNVEVLIALCGLGGKRVRARDQRLGRLRSRGLLLARDARVRSRAAAARRTSPCRASPTGDEEARVPTGFAHRVGAGVVVAEWLLRRRRLGWEERVLLPELVEVR